MLIAPSLQRCAMRVSSSTGSISPEYPTRGSGTWCSDSVMTQAAVMVPGAPKRCGPKPSMAAAIESAISGAGVGSNPQYFHPVAASTPGAKRARSCA
jgi:hypothetical protein